MPFLVPPTIASKQNVYDFCGITATQAAAAPPSGVGTIATYIQTLLDSTAREIVGYLDYDYSMAQQPTFEFQGNGQQFIRLKYPASSISAFNSWNPLAPTVAVVNEGIGNIAINTMDPKILIRSDNKIFEPTLIYQIAIVTAADQTYGQWPQAIIQVQVEAVARLLYSSSNYDGTNGGQSLLPTELLRIRPFKRFLA